MYYAVRKGVKRFWCVYIIGNGASVETSESKRFAVERCNELNTKGRLVSDPITGLHHREFETGEPAYRFA